ncbi:MAG: hypothetical protein V1887_02855 [Candidatus Aenigmatarchaeota archaeon]
MMGNKEIKFAVTAAEKGRQRLVRYIDEGRAPGVPDHLREALAIYHVPTYRDRDKALETFERDCEFCGLPSVEELDDKIRANDHVPPIDKLDSRLVRIHVKPVIEAFPKESTA